MVGVGIIAFDLIDRDVDCLGGLHGWRICWTDGDSELAEDSSPLRLLFIPGSDAFNLGFQLFAVFC